MSIPKVFADSGIRDILEKAVAGDRLSTEDGVRLYASNDLAAMGWAANVLRERRHGDVTYYLKNRHINYSNVCKYDCFFCSFFRKSADDEGAWEWTVEDVLNHVADYKDTGLQEFHIVGGVHPDLPFSYYTDMLSALRREHPGVALKAFTAIEIAYFAELTGKSIGEVLSELKDAGLAMLPGGGAEVFADRVRYKVCREKADADRWFDVHREAHALGLPTNCTMLYGHIETAEERVDHLMRLRDLQDETGGMLSYIPLRFHPDNNLLGSGKLGRTDRRRGAQEHRDRPPAARQHPAHQGVLGHARHQARPARPLVWRERHRRHRHLGAHLPDGGCHHDARTDDRRATLRSDPRGGSHARWSATPSTTKWPTRSRWRSRDYRAPLRRRPRTRGAADRSGRRSHDRRRARRRWPKRAPRSRRCSAPAGSP